MSAADPRCPTCGVSAASTLRAAERVLFRCRACSAIYDGGPVPTVRALVPMPRGITVEAAPAAEAGYRDAPSVRRIVLVYRWYAPAAWAVVLFVLVWIALASRPGPRGFSLVPVLAGGVVLYASVAALVNRTTLSIVNERLSVRHGPLPWLGRKDVAVRDIAQLYCDASVVSGRNGARRTYHLGAVLRDGSKLRLLSSLPEPELALFLEQRIEEHLGIADVPVAGEYEGARLPPRA